MFLNVIKHKLCHFATVGKTADALIVLLFGRGSHKTMQSFVCNGRSEGDKVHKYIIIYDTHHRINTYCPIGLHH